MEIKCSDQSSVVSERAMPGLGQRRSPPLPHVANPISWIVLRNRLVSREDGSSSSGSRSVKIFREGDPLIERAPLRPRYHGWHVLQQYPGLGLPRREAGQPAVRPQ
jgi:hypothetical protein